MKAPDILIAVNRLLVATNSDDDLTATQLRNLLHDFETILVNAIKNAPCDHNGTRWVSTRGKTFCGMCSREVSVGEPV